MIVNVILVLRFFSCLWRAKAGDMWDDDFDLERQLKILNKPALKTFKTQEGEIIDCVHIYAQPAFDHPLLKNHRLQKSPSPALVTSFSQNSQDIKSAPFKAREPCPNGTVPIVRVHKQDLIRAKSLPEEINLKNGQTDWIPGHHVVQLTINNPYLLKYGGGGMASIYNLTLQNDQFSGVQLWVASGPQASQSMIIAGWRVFPQLNGDGLTRLFTYWTRNSQGGCYNTLCPGFVQVHRVMTPNYPMFHTSTRGGKQMALIFQVKQDRQTGNWWLIVKGSIGIGYWPKELFERLRDGSDYIAYGAVGKAGNNGMLPPLGSGYWPDGNFSNSCFFAKLHYIDSDNTTKLLPSKEFLSIHLDKCYGFVYHGFVSDPPFQFTVELGGPGGKCG